MFTLKVKDSNNTSGRGRISCPLYNEIDAILGISGESMCYEIDII